MFGVLYHYYIATVVDIKIKIVMYGSRLELN